MKNARAKRAKLLFFIVKYANLSSSCWRLRLGFFNCLMANDDLLSMGICDSCVSIGQFGKYLNTLCLSPKILHKHCFQFLLGLTMIPRENKNNAYAKFWGKNKEYFGIFRTGLLKIETSTFSDKNCKSAGSWTRYSLFHRLPYLWSHSNYVTNLKICFQNVTFSERNAVAPTSNFNNQYNHILVIQ